MHRVPEPTGRHRLSRLLPFLPVLLVLVPVMAGRDHLWAGYTVSEGCGRLPGSLDDSFSGDGRLLAGSSAGEGARAVVLQPDGSIVSGGYILNGGDGEFALARHDASGNAIATFGTDGWVSTNFGSGLDQVYALALQPDGAIVAAGETGNGSDIDFALARYETDGSLDMLFGSSGRVTTDFGEGNDVIRALALQPDGKIVAAGVAGTGNGTGFALARYTNDGSLDPAFGSSGLVTTTVGSYDGAYALLLLSDGALLAAGYHWNGSNYDLALARYLADGSLDHTFGESGLVITDVGGRSERLLALAERPDGSVVAAGHSADIPLGGNYDFLLAAYNSSGSLEAGFGTGGLVLVDRSGDDALEALALQEDGKVVAAGYVLNTSYDFAVTRYYPDGTPDATFGVDGLQTVDMAGGADLGHALLIQPDGRLLLAGSAGTSGQSDMGLARLERGTPCLTISRRESDVLLEWTGTGSDLTYVCRSTDNPLGDGQLIGSGTGSFTDRSALGDPDHNHSYRLVPQPDCVSSPASNRVGEFDFLLAAGSEAMRD